MLRTKWSAVATVVGACLLGAPSAQAGSGGELRGRVALGLENLPLAAVAPVVVYLQALDATPDAPPRTEARMYQRDARFTPPFLVVTVGQPIAMANDDAIYHNVFSYSRPNDFDLGLYPAGESRKLVLRHPGVVKLYCSIHESMSATILVTPTRWYDVVNTAGAYAITGIRPGRYRAVVWADRLPPTSSEIEIRAGQKLQLDWVIGTPSAS